MLTLKQIVKVSRLIGQTDEYARREAERQLIKKAADEHGSKKTEGGSGTLCEQPDGKRVEDQGTDGRHGRHAGFSFCLAKHNDHGL